jgi:CO/xanthine dehydrogenase FAD-binding subunit
VLTYHIPDTTQEVLTLRAEHGAGSMLMGGGTIVMTMMNEGLPHPEVVIGMKRAGLDKIASDNGSRLVGAMATIAAVASDDHPMLSRAAQACGGWAIRNMATIGGNLFAPAPAGDLGVALLALDAALRIESLEGRRTVPIGVFFDDGRRLDEREVLTGVEVPAPGAVTRFVKYGRKHGPTPSVVTVAISLRMDGQNVSDARIALGSMGPHPVRARRAESMLDGHELTPQLIEEAADATTEGLDGLTDAVASGWYRRRMASLHVGRLLTDVMDEGRRE